MPKLTTHPGLRHHIRKSKRTGRVRAYYYLDHRMFGTEKDIPLGTDYEEAVRQWDEWRNKKPRIRGTLEEAFKRWEEEVLPGYDNAGTRKNYRLSLKRLREVFGQATWEATKLHHLKAYLKARSAKRQANHEMSLLSIIWNWARTEGITELPWPAHGMEKAKWRNKENPRQFEVTDALFAAIYEQADSTLRAAMDLSTATGARLTDCLRLTLPPEGKPLMMRASKTGKSAQFLIDSSPTLTALLERRRTLSGAAHLFLLSTPAGKPVTLSMLRSRYDTARAAAAKKAEEAGDMELAKQIRAMFLRDCRKRAADLAGSAEEASRLLQHSSVSLTSKHYRTRADQLRPVR